MNHPERSAAALQCASITPWSDAINVLSHTPLLKVLPMDDFDVTLAHAPHSHAIFWGHMKGYYGGNSALGMCEDCAYEFWQAFEFPPLYVTQHAIFSSHVTITRTSYELDFSPHSYQIMRLETPSGLSNKVELVCPDCINRRFLGPHLIKLDEFTYE
jgi:hypothetical protein